MNAASNGQTSKEQDRLEWRRERRRAYYLRHPEKIFHLAPSLVADRRMNRASNTSYTSWRAMIVRCTNPNNKSYKNYAGRGITVCDRWLNSYGNFLEDMSEKPKKGWHIHRLDNDGNYEPGNCEWFSAEEHRQIHAEGARRKKARRKKACDLTPAFEILARVFRLTNETEVAA